MSDTKIARNVDYKNIFTDFKANTLPESMQLYLPEMTEKNLHQFRQPLTSASLPLTLICFLIGYPKPGTTDLWPTHTYIAPGNIRSATSSVFGLVCRSSIRLFFSTPVHRVCIWCGYRKSKNQKIKSTSQFYWGMFCCCCRFNTSTHRTRGS